MKKTYKRPYQRIKENKGKGQNISQDKKYSIDELGETLPEMRPEVVLNVPVALSAFPQSSYL